MNCGPLITGIPSFGPGAKRILSWGQYGGLHKSIGDSYIDIKASYKSDTPLSIKQRIHTTTSRVDVKSLEHTDISDTNWDQKAAEALSGIEKIVKQLSFGGKLKISIESVPENNEENS